MFISVLNNANSFSMKVRDSSDSSDNGWRKVWGKEAAAVNPLAAVNHGRNSLILESIRTNDWTSYNNFQTKQHPAWYDKVNGEMKQNKLYYGNLIDVQHRSLKEAMQSGDQVEITKRKAHLEELIGDFKKAPGEIPHVVAFVQDPALASAHGIEKPSNDWYNSPYNNSMAAQQGQFKEQNWFDNPYFAGHPGEMQFALEAVQEFRPAIAAIAATINRGAYERNVASTAVSRKREIEDDQKIEVLESDKGLPVTEDVQLDVISPVTDTASTETFLQQATDIISQFSSTNLVEQLFKQNDQVQRSAAADFLMDELTRTAEEEKLKVV